ncbi:MAG: OB-fold nucleic acid binding domain-containing protein, partial [Cyclobacteriaceae bacterium]
QEQVMLLSHKLAGFSKGDADVLRKAMGKKQKSVLDKMKDKFIEGCKKNGHPPDVCEKIWTDWEAFAQYAFNKSHSTCYSLIAYHTAYLKANFPAEYMAAVLTHSQSNLENVTFFIEECRNLGIKVLGPHVNESGMYFEVNKNGEIRFGLGAIKGAGDAAVEAIIQEREAKGNYTDIFEFSKRLNQRAVNKKTFECLALSGAFDCFKDLHRRQYVYAKDGDVSLIEKAIKYAAKTQLEEQSAQVSLFGGTSGTAMPKPRIENVEPFTELEKLNLEREVVGIYISGHPLDNFTFELSKFCNTSCSQLTEIENLEGRDIRIGGMVTSLETRTTKTGSSFGKFTLSDYTGNFNFVLFGRDYVDKRKFMIQGEFLFIEGTVQRSSWGNQNLEFRIRNIELLNEIAEKRSNGLTITVNYEDVTMDFIKKFEDILKEYKGNTSLYLRFSADHEENKSTTPMLVRNFRVVPGTAIAKRIKHDINAEMDLMR